MLLNKDTKLTDIIESIELTTEKPTKEHIYFKVKDYITFFNNDLSGFINATSSYLHYYVTIKPNVLEKIFKSRVLSFTTLELLTCYNGLHLYAGSVNISSRLLTVIDKKEVESLLKECMIKDIKEVIIQ